MAKGKNVEAAVADTAAEKQKVPTRPDEKLFQNRIDSLEKEIDEKKKKQQQLTAAIEKRSVGKQEYLEQKRQLDQRLEQTKKEKEDLKEKKQGLLQKSKQAKSDLRSTEKKAKEKNEEDIDREIQKLEYYMQTGTNSLNEEKMLMKQIKKLKTVDKPEARKAAQDLARLKGDSVAAESDKPISDQLDELSEQIAALGKQQNAELDLIKDMKKNRFEQTQGVDDLIKERKSLQDAVKDLAYQRKAIRDEKQAAWDGFRQHEKDQREKRDKQWADEQARWDAEWAADEARRELEKPNPFLKQTTLLEQTINYCKNLVKKQVVEEKKEEFDVSSLPTDVTVLQKGKEQDMFFAGTKNKKALKPKPVAEKPKSSNIKHTADSFQTFQELKMKAPLTTADVPPILEELESKLAEVKATAKEWEDERKKKVEEAKKLEVKSAE